MKILASPLKELWVSVPGTLRVARGEMIFLRLRSGQCWQVTQEQGLVWQFFQEAQSLEEATFYFERDCAWTRAELGLLRPILSQLEEQGLVTTRDGFRKCFAVTKSSELEPEVSLQELIIPTFNRPEGLRRFLTTWEGYGKKWGRSFNYLIGDDSHVGQAEQNEQIIREQNEAGSRVRYFGRKQRRLFSAELARRAGVEASLVDFALLGVNGLSSCGANRNGLMLARAGQAMVTIDDDVLPSFHGSKKADATLAFGQGYTTDEFEYFPNREALLKAYPFVQDQDVLKSLEKVLGKTPKKLLENSGLDIALDRCQSSSLEFFFRSESRVRFALTGTLGDDTSRLPQIGSGLMSSKTDWKSTVQYRESLKKPAYTYLQPSSYCVGALLAMDGRSMLPPFFPLLRGEDCLFGVLMSITDRGSLGAAVPWAAHHAPLEARQAYLEVHCEIEKWNPFAESWHFFRLALSVAVGSQPLNAVKEHHGLSWSFESLGKALIDLSQLPLAEFEDAMETTFLTEMGALLFHLDKTLSEELQDREKVKALEMAIQRLIGLSRSPKVWLTQDILSLYGEEAVSWARKHLGLWGQLLTVWPGLWSAAVACRESGWTEVTLGSVTKK